MIKRLRGSSTEVLYLFVFCCFATEWIILSMQQWKLVYFHFHSWYFNYPYLSCPNTVTVFRMMVFRWGRVPRLVKERQNAIVLMLHFN